MRLLSRSRPRRFVFRGGISAAALGALLFLSACGPDRGSRTGTAEDLRAEGPFPLTHRPERLDRVGEQACKECHAEIFDDWSRSHHAHANRRIRPAVDRPAFEPTREVTEGDDHYRLVWTDEGPTMNVRRGEEETTYPLEGVLAYEPLRQYLVPLEGGRWQSTTVAFDPAEKEWFDVFEGEDRQPGEWGHWTGQGMNWNANCAYCHMTEFSKELDPPTGNYHSTWTRQAISCVQCHGDLEAHVATASPDSAGELPRRLSQVQIDASCATCHSRRDQLTAEEFRPGDSYHDHFDLTLPENEGPYYADGQIRGEVFVWGSFQMSRMGHAGIGCMDCHDPHSMELTRPTRNNAACTWCHDGGLDGATVIEPLAHSHHPAGSTGNRCVECHMPKTTYMQRDPRADHGFLSPDPAMTRELGIPNACNDCHTEETVEWAEKWVDEWYPEKNVLSRQRERARALTKAWDGDPAVAEKLLELAGKEPVRAWKATYTGALGRFVDEPGVEEYLLESLDDPSSLVRSRAAAGLGNAGRTSPRFDRLLDDPNRNVRIAAAGSYARRGESIPDASAAAEFEEYLLFNSDRPQTALLLADRAVGEGNRREAARWIERAVSIEPANPELLRRAAVLRSRLGEPERAGELLEKAYALAPENAVLPYSLALLKAEQGDLDGTVRLLEVATRLDPEFHRAWYNLALALLRQGKPDEAREALRRARPGLDPRIHRQAEQAIDRAGGARR